MAVDANSLYQFFGSRRHSSYSDRSLQLTEKPAKIFKDKDMIIPRHIIIFIVLGVKKRRTAKC